MKDRDIFGWIVVGVNWYTIIVLGGIIVFVTGFLKRIHDLWLILWRDKDETKYYINQSLKKLLISFLPLFLAAIINILTIILVMPFLMGLQHLIRIAFKKDDKIEKDGEDSFKDGKKWYDGIIYSAGVDPGLKDTRQTILNLVSENSQVIDICCGTGELVFTLANKCDRVVGVDYSSKMIAFAKNQKASRSFVNVDFSLENAMDLSKFKEKEFDLSIMSLTLHEMHPSIRIAVLKEARRISKQILILDYKTPAPMNWNGITALFFEFVAGYDHLKHYLHYRDKGGLDYLLDETGLERESEIIAQNGTIEIVKIK